MPYRGRAGRGNDLNSTSVGVMRSGPVLPLDEMRVLLARVPAFDGFVDGEIEELANGAELKEHGDGEIIFREGDAAEGVFLLLSGRVRIYCSSAAGSDFELTVLGPGSYFGELALFDGAPRSASVIAITRATTLLVRKNDFERLLALAPGRAGKLLADMSAKLRASNHAAYTQMIEKLTVRAQLEHERYRSLSQMVAGVAHELNTPLGIVSTGLSVLLERLGDEAIARPDATPAARKEAIADAIEAAKLIEQNLARAIRLVQTFKSLSVKQVSDTKHEHDLVELLSEIVELFSPRARSAKLEVLLIDRLSPTDRTWMGYAECLTQVLHNLLANVERYAYPNGAGGRVEIEVREDGPGPGSPFLIAVRDLGVGISKEHQGRVFEAFFTTGRSRGGTGLGLSIVEALVKDALKGTIALRSEPGHGTEFSIRLPRTVPDQGPVRPDGGSE
jgi:signal transduction histidine kinase